MNNNDAAYKLLDILSGVLVNTRPQGEDCHSQQNLHTQGKDLYSQEVYLLAAKQGILPLLYDVKDEFGREHASIIEKHAIACANQSIKLTYLARYFINRLKREKITCCLIKGADLAGYYPVSEYRSFADIDLLLIDKDKADEAVKLLNSLGCIVAPKQDSRHHICLIYEGRIEVELHIKPVRSFDNEKVNEIIDDIFTLSEADLEYKTVFGMRLPVLPRALSGLYNLLHIAQHYMNSGFGISHLCDWALFMKGQTDDSEMEAYKAYVERLGLRTFSNTLCNICFLYLKVPMEKLPYTDVDKNIAAYEIGSNSVISKLLEEMSDSGKYGREDPNRVVNLKSSGLVGLFKEFHHQTGNNYPKARRIFIIWPVLWTATLIRFLRNNRRVRNTSARAVLSSSVKRSKLTKELRLWEGMETK